MSTSRSDNQTLNSSLPPTQALLRNTNPLKCASVDSLLGPPDIAASGVKQGSQTWPRPSMQGWSPMGTPQRPPPPPPPL